MKKIIFGMAALVASALPAMAAEVAYNQALANEVVTTTKSYTLDLSAYGIDAISFQATLSSANPQQQIFKDGNPSSGTITVVSTAGLVPAPSSDTIKVSTTSALAATFGSISVLVSSAGPGPLTFSTLTINGVNIYPGTAVISVSSNAYATWISTTINSTIPNITASAGSIGGGTITITCNTAGLFCNSYTIKSSTVALKIYDSTGTYTQGPAFFYGGNDNASFNLNGSIFPQGTTWVADVTYASNTAVSIANAIDTLSGYVASTVTANTVLITCATNGTACNSTTLTASTGALTIGNATFTGGQNNAVLTINGTALTQGTDWTVVGSSVQVSTAIAAAINANVVLSRIMTASASTTCPGCGIIYASGTVLTSGSNNYAWYASTQALSLSSTTLLNGSTSAVIINVASITIPSHGYATGEAVRFTSGTIALSPLINQTTYYVIAVDANNIELALTSTSSLAGSYITLTSTAAGGPHTFTLNPLSLAGVESLSWSVSNDGITYSSPTVTASNVTIPVNNFATPFATIAYSYDFGNITYRYLRLTATGPSTAGNGGFNTVVTGYGKRYWR